MTLRRRRLPLPQRRLLLLLLVPLVAPSLSLDAHGAPDAHRGVTDLRVLMLEAIDSGDGTASGDLVSKEALAIAARMKASGPLHAEIRTLARYAQDGCRRLQLIVRARNAQVGRESQRHDQDLIYDFDYCRSGYPPRSREVAP